MKIPKLIVREAVMDPDRDNRDGVNKYELVAYRWKRRLVAKSGGIGISAVVCIYVCMYVSMHVWMYVCIVCILYEQLMSQ